MPKIPISIKVIQEGDERYILKTFADGREERVQVVKQPGKPSHFPYRTVSLNKSTKKGF